MKNEAYQIGSRCTGARCARHEGESYLMLGVVSVQLSGEDDSYLVSMPSLDDQVYHKSGTSKAQQNHPD